MACNGGSSMHSKDRMTSFVKFLNSLICTVACFESSKAPLVKIGRGTRQQKNKELKTYDFLRSPDPERGTQRILHTIQEDLKEIRPVNTNHKERKVWSQDFVSFLSFLVFVCPTLLGKEEQLRGGPAPVFTASRREYWVT